VKRKISEFRKPKKKNTKDTIRRKIKHKKYSYNPERSKLIAIRKNDREKDNPESENQKYYNPE
jgi:hypothetical protein